MANIKSEILPHYTSKVVQPSAKVMAHRLLFSTNSIDLGLGPACVRKGTRVLGPSPSLPASGEGAASVSPPKGVLQSNVPSPTEVLEENVPPLAGGPQGGPIPIESLAIGDLVFGHDGKSHKILRVICKSYRGSMVGIKHKLSPETLWLTSDHRVLTRPRPRTLGGNRDWSAVPQGHLERQRQMRREPSPGERRLWSALRKKQLGFKFRRQHPIGRYIADFYSREAHLVVEVDGAGHFTDEARSYDAERDAFMRCLELDVLRFTTIEVERNLEGVCLAIESQCRLRTQSIEGAKWIQAGSLQPGDLVFYSFERIAVKIVSVETNYAEENVYNLKVEGVHSFLTEVCTLHDCETTVYVA